MAALPSNGSDRLKMMAGGSPAHSISDAVADLNRSGFVVDLYGFLWIEGERVELQVRDRRMQAVTRGTVIPWHLFRQVLRRSA